MSIFPTTTSLFTPIISHGFGMINTLAPLVGLTQYYQIILKKKTFGALAFFALGGLSADFSCLLAWLTNQSNFQTLTYGNELLLVFAPLPIATAVMFWIQKNRAIAPIPNEYLCSTEKDIYNRKFVFSAVFILLVAGGYFTFNTPAGLRPCDPDISNCALHDWLFGDKLHVYRTITIDGFLVTLSGSVLLFNLYTIFRNNRTS